MSSQVFQKSRKGLVMLVMAAFFALSALSLPTLIDDYTGTSFVTSALADDYEDTGD
ncbi:MAG: hypothetical protein AAF702_03555 [Chloroflexota bacterium]